jgi:hypothetical protein
VLYVVVGAQPAAATVVVVNRVVNALPGVSLEFQQTFKPVLFKPEKHASVCVLVLYLVMRLNATAVPHSNVGGWPPNYATIGLNFSIHGTSVTIFLVSHYLRSVNEQLAKVCLPDVSKLSVTAYVTAVDWLSLSHPCLQ